MQGWSLHGSCCVATPPLVQSSRSHRLASVSSMVASDPCDALKNSDLCLCCMEIRSFGHGCVRGQKLRGGDHCGVCRYRSVTREEAQQLWQHAYNASACGSTSKDAQVCSCTAAGPVPMRRPLL